MCKVLGGGEEDNNRKACLGVITINLSYFEVVHTSRATTYVFDVRRDDKAKQRYLLGKLYEVLNDNKH